MIFIVAFFICQVLCNLVSCVNEKNFYYPDDPGVQGIGNVLDNRHTTTSETGDLFYNPPDRTDEPPTNDFHGIDENLVAEIFGPDPEKTDTTPTIPIFTAPPEDDKKNFNIIKPSFKPPHSSQPPPVPDQQVFHHSSERPPVNDQQQLPANLFQPQREQNHQQLPPHLSQSPVINDQQNSFPHSTQPPQVNNQQQLPQHFFQPSRDQNQQQIPSNSYQPSWVPGQQFHQHAFQQPQNHYQHQYPSHTFQQPPVFQGQQQFSTHTFHQPSVMQIQQQQVHKQQHLPANSFHNQQSTIPIYVPPGYEVQEIVLHSNQPLSDQQIQEVLLHSSQQSWDQQAPVQMNTPQVHSTFETGQIIPSYTGDYEMAAPHIIYV